jgi:hypothetical protein
MRRPCSLGQPSRHPPGRDRQLVFLRPWQLTDIFCNDGTSRSATLVGVRGSTGVQHPMLTQAEADALVAMEKRFLDRKPVAFPRSGTKTEYGLVSADGRHRFIADANRASIRLSKCTYQERYNVVEVLVRLCVDGAAHENPDGTVIPCPHLHIWKQDAADRWAIPAPAARFPKPGDLVRTLRDFLNPVRHSDCMG